MKSSNNYSARTRCFCVPSLLLGWLFFFLVIFAAGPATASAQEEDKEERCRDAVVRLTASRRQLEAAKDKYRAVPNEANFGEVLRLADDVGIRVVARRAGCDYYEDEPNELPYCLKYEVHHARAEAELAAARDKYRAIPNEANFAKVKRLVWNEKDGRRLKSEACGIEDKSIYGEDKEASADCLRTEVLLAQFERELAAARKKYQARPNKANLAATTRLAGQVNIRRVAKSAACGTSDEIPAEETACTKADAVLARTERELAFERRRYNEAPSDATRSVVIALIRKVNLHRAYKDAECLTSSETEAEDLPVKDTSGVRACDAEEQAVWARMTGTWDASYGKVTFSGSCENVTGYWKQGEWGDRGDKLRGEISGGRVNGTSLTFNYSQSWNNKSGSDSCSLSQSRNNKLECSYMGSLQR